MMKKIFCPVIAGILLLASAVSAHEFIVKPVMMHSPSQPTIGFNVISAHVFMASEEMEALKNVAVSVFGPKGQADVALKENPLMMTLDGQAPVAEAMGYTLIYGHRKPVVWSKTTSGWKEGGKKGDKGVIFCNKYEKFCKTLVRSGKGNSGFDQKVNCRLEIIPRVSPAEIRPGMEMDVDILYDNKPIATKVLATYDGFSGQSNTWAYASESKGSGLARVKITHPGVWMVRVEKKNKTQGSGYDAHIMRSVLVFEIK